MQRNVSIKMRRNVQKMQVLDISYEQLQLAVFNNYI